ncbi:hypothetical protein [Sulfolobus sp. E11-6]|uniref:hypothetical protein n=1 Tax=Sulfolobus sp. E11-6 TaxID=2663020 RepID=UPI00129758CF|nr:hypothetical protein [Sulfolobus sp. E11-6]QGA68902.1 hypothetical protein GFS33_09370 [Sulfolobus sp. E11-6]
MTIVIIGELINQGGGSVRNEELLKRFKSKIDFIFIPSIRWNIYPALVNLDYCRRLKEKIFELNLNVPDFILKLLEDRRKYSIFSLINFISKN